MICAVASRSRSFSHNGQRFAFRRLGIEHMQNDADENCLGRTVPEILMPPIALRIDEYLNDVLDVADFVVVSSLRKAD